MALFEKFTDTIFLKNDSNLENIITTLQTIYEKNPSNYLIEKDLALFKRGYNGEKEIEYELKNANIGMFVLKDINLQYEDLTAQIDYVVVTTGKVYLIECKNMVGNIRVNERGDFIREIFDKKEGIYSPLRQAERHVEILKKIWLSRSNFIKKFFAEEKFDYWYVPLVVFADSKSILNTKYAPKYILNKVVKSDQLVNYIKNDLKKIDKSLLSGKKKTEEIAKSILALHTPIQYNFKKYETINNSFSTIRNKLIEFRKNKSKEKNIPLYYIFSNEELDKIIKTMPKSINELEHQNILSNIKLRCHGKEIIDIINQNLGDLNESE